MTYRTLVIVALALVFGLSAAVGFKLFHDELQRGRAEPIATVSVVVAATEIPRGVVIAPNQLKLRKHPVDALPPGAITDLEQVRGRITFHPIVKEDMILESKLVGKDAGRGLASMIQTGKRAFTIHTPSVVSGVAGFILPGNRVDVLLTLGSNGTTGGAITTTLLPNVEILAVDQRLDPPLENRVDYRGLQSVTLLVTPDEANQLDLGQNRGTLHLALRNPEDLSTALAKPATLAGLPGYRDKQVQVAKHEEKEKVAPPPLAPPPPPPVLEVRTLRGMYHGVIQID